MRRRPGGGHRRPRPSGWWPSADRPGSSRPGTASCSPRPGSTRPTPSPAPWCCCPSTRTRRPARCASRLRERPASTSRVVVTDTIGRAWRTGPDRPGHRRRRPRPAGRPARPRRRARQRAARRPIPAVADEVASAAELVKGKLGRRAGRGRPRARLHAVPDEDGPGAAALVRPAEEDLFRLGTQRPARGGDRAAYRPRIHRPSRSTPRQCAVRWRRPSPRRRRTTRRRGGSSSSSRPDAGAAARRDARCVGGGPAPGRLHRGADRTADPARRRAAAGAVPRRALPRRRRGARLPGRAPAPPPSARCSSSRWARASRTCSLRWPPKGSARRGSPPRCSAATWCAANSTCPPTGSRWAPSRSVTLPAHRPSARSATPRPSSCSR